METANRRNAAMAMSTLPRFAGGGLIEGFKKAIGITPESPELKAYKERAAAERAVKAAKPAAQVMAEPPKSAIGDYVGNSALDKRMKAADAMASGGPIKGPGTGTSDDVPIMASNGEFMVRKAAVDVVGTEVLEAINALGEDQSTADDPEDKQPGQYAVGGLVDEQQRLINQIPTGGNGRGPTPQPDPSMSASGSDFGRNVSNTLSALPGAAPAFGAASRLAAVSPMVNKAASGVAGAAGGLASAAKPVLPYVPPVGGAAALIEGGATPSIGSRNPASGSPDEKTVASSQRTGGSTGNAGRGVMMPAGTVLDNGNTAPIDPRSRNFSAELNKVPANLPSDLREGVIHKTVGADGRVTYSGRNVAPGADGKTQMVDGLGKTLESKGQVLTSGSAPVAGPNGGFAIDNNGPSAAQRMAQTSSTLTNPDGSRWSEGDNAIMAANIRDGVDPTRGTQRGMAAEKMAVLQGLALSPNGTPGKSNAVKILAMQSDERRTAATQQTERDKLALTAKGAELDNTGKQQTLDAQRALTEAKTPAERRSAMEVLAGLQGRMAQAPQDEYAYAPGGQEVVANQLVTRPGVIFNKRTGAVSAPQGKAEASADDFVSGKVYVDGKGNRAKWDGKQFVPA